MTRLLLFLVMLLVLVLAPLPLACLSIASLNSAATAWAQDTPNAGPAANAHPLPDFSELKRTGSGRVDKVIDGLTLLLTDGRIVRLSSLEIPDFTGAPDDGSGPAPYAAAAFDALSLLVPPGTPVILYQTRAKNKGRTNRMRHMLAHAVRSGPGGTREEPSGLWLQGMLLKKGLARFFPTLSNPELAPAMLAAEQAARAAGQGMWQNNAPDHKSDHKSDHKPGRKGERATPYPVLTPANAAGGTGSFQIVEGTVVSAASVRNNIYLNFGTDWRSDFTVMIAPPVRKMMARTGTDPLSLEGRTIRVRGWLRTYNGPFLELIHPSALEIPADKS